MNKAKLDTRIFYETEDCHYNRHVGIVVDAKNDGTETITYYNGNSVRRDERTFVGAWTRLMVWRGKSRWYVTDRLTGGTWQTDYAKRDEAIAACAQIASEMVVLRQTDKIFHDEYWGLVNDMRHVERWRHTNGNPAVITLERVFRDLHLDAFGNAYV